MYVILEIQAIKSIKQEMNDAIRDSYIAMFATIIEISHRAVIPSFISCFNIFNNS